MQADSFIGRKNCIYMFINLVDLLLMPEEDDDEEEKKLATMLSSKLKFS